MSFEPTTMNGTHVSSIFDPCFILPSSSNLMRCGGLSSLSSLPDTFGQKSDSLFNVQD